MLRPKTRSEHRSLAVPTQAIAPGTELIVDQCGYRHHGIYVGNGRVIHYRGWISILHGLVEECALEDFLGRHSWRQGQTPKNPAHGDAIVLRARSRVGERNYSIIWNNCEHLCSWCHSGESRSAQVDRVRCRVRRMLSLVQLGAPRPVALDPPASFHSSGSSREA